MSLKNKQTAGPRINESELSGNDAVPRNYKRLDTNPFPSNNDNNNNSNDNNNN